VGRPGLPVTPLAGDLEHGCPAPDYDSALANLLSASPEVLFANAEVRRGQVSLRREEVEPVPNLQLQGGPQYDVSSRRMAGFAQVGLRVPLFDRNQGNIRTAQAQLAHSVEEVRRVELDLGRRLARTFANYRAALNVVETYRKENLPEAREAYELYLDGFRRRRAAYPQVLIAQRNYFQIAEEYVQALEAARRAEVAILGLLLVDGLDEPPPPPGEGGGAFQRRDQQSGPADFRRSPLGGEGRGLDERLGNPPQ
jgi:cobalt-zinc-cadmium efflux system outer membrane protein